MQAHFCDLKYQIDSPFELLLVTVLSGKSAAGRRVCSMSQWFGPNKTIKTKNYHKLFCGGVGGCGFGDGVGGWWLW